jgi:hypothetical protein
MRQSPPGIGHARVSPEGRLSFRVLCELQTAVSVFPIKIRLLHAAEIMNAGGNSMEGYVIFIWQPRMGAL